MNRSDSRPALRRALRLSTMTLLPLSAALTLAAQGTTAFADPLPSPGQCLSATNASTGQTLQVCGIYVASASSKTNGASVSLTCYADSGPANLSTQIACSVQSATGYSLTAPSQALPGDASATGAVGTDPNVEPLTLCMQGSAADVNGNTVSIPLTCG